MGAKEASSGCLWAAIEARKGAAAVRVEAVAPACDALMPRAGDDKTAVTVLGAAHVECDRSNGTALGLKVRVDKMPLVGRRVGLTWRGVAVTAGMTTASWIWGYAAHSRCRPRAGGVLAMHKPSTNPAQSNRGQQGQP